LLHSAALGDNSKGPESITAPLADHFVAEALLLKKIRDAVMDSRIDPQIQNPIIARRSQPRIEKRAGRLL
jgi:hypothetical protein